MQSVTGMQGRPVKEAKTLMSNGPGQQNMRSYLQEPGGLCPPPTLGVQTVKWDGAPLQSPTDHSPDIIFSAF